MSHSDYHHTQPDTISHSQSPSPVRVKESNLNKNKTADEVEPGESTPKEFAPANPTEQDLRWPRVLDDIVSRLISAARGTPTLTNNSTSLSAAAVTEPIPNARACSQSLTESTPGTLDGQSQGDPVNRDIP